MRYGIIGTGAIGGYYGAKLARAGQEVHFLLRREQMMEVVGAAQHLGVKNLDASFVDKMIEMTDAMTPYSPSMRLDYDFHRRMEIYYLYTRPIEIAREAGFRMPKLEMLEAELQFLEETLVLIPTSD